MNPQESTNNPPQKVYIRTFGCQMNERDSENMMGLLVKQNYIQTPDPAEADLILVNTCSIREHASEKAASQLGRLAKIKASSLRKPMIGVTGCLIQQEKKAFLKRFPFVDLLLGPDVLHRLPEMIALKQQQKKSVFDFHQEIHKPTFLHEYLPYLVQKPQVWDADLHPRASAYVVISKGCDFRCTFCVVPHTRGGEVSVPADELMDEIRFLAQRGIREITLLGQNVNSYGKNFSKPFLFPDLLHRIEKEIPKDSSLQRLRFTTSHPIDFSEALSRCFSQLPRLCPHLHLPVQSGSDRILKRMKRLYCISDYRQRLISLRQNCPEIALTTDIIVGFPGEKEEDFSQTLDLLEEIGYTNLYAFTYSRRPHTPALNFCIEDEVPEEVKDERLSRLLQVQEKISLEKNAPLKDSEVDVLVEGINERKSRHHAQADIQHYSGRMGDYRPVHFQAPRGAGNLIAKLVKVRIHTAQAHSFLGRFIEGSAW